MKRRLILTVLPLLGFMNAAFAGHQILSFTMQDSKTYPGTIHPIRVYVPDQYDPAHPACLFVGLDGIQCDAPKYFDELIENGRMPITIGVFIDPGWIQKGEIVVRYNRSNEFDPTDARFAEFVMNEVIPLVTSKTSEDGRQIHIAPEPSAHAIFGLSSGGIAAFNAAWQRPDLFGRVFSAVGTFVAFRGGYDLHSFVRKTEPLPLRIFLQDGSQDVWNPLFGHWYEANRTMESALLFAGYDLACDWSDGGHNSARATEIFPEVMEWLWMGYPEELAKGKTNNDLLAPLLINGEFWRPDSNPVSSKTFKKKTGEFDAVYPDGSLGVRKIKNDNCLWQYVIDPAGHSSAGQRFYFLHVMDNKDLPIGPMAFDAAGNLYVCTGIGIQICDQNGRVRGILRFPWEETHSLPDGLKITDGSICIRFGKKVYNRRLNIKAPAKGVRPASQGAG